MTTTNTEMYLTFIKAFAPNGRILSVKSLKGGLSAETILIEFETDSGEINKIVVRRPPPWVLEKNSAAALTEFNLLNQLCKLNLKVPKPIFLDQEGKFFGTPCLAVDYEEGETNFCPDNLNTTLNQMATELVKIHKITAEDLDQTIAPKSIQIFPRKKDILYSPAEIKAINFLEKNWPLNSKNKPVLIHGDFWPGNLIWQNGELKSIIDWEASGLGDPLLDLAISRLDVLWLYGRIAMDEFTHNYQEISDLDISNLPYWDLWAAHRTGGKFALWASVYPELGHPDVTESIMRERHEDFVHQALDKLNSNL
jgi:aminoglycoside phosphotransferase (APT) family kinase protein